MKKQNIHIGLSSFNNINWKEIFYPEDLPQKQELAWASRQLPTIEINGTFYRNQKPATFAKWRDETPGGFLFSIKASQFCTHRKVLAESGESVRRFVSSGLTELGEKLGPIVWQFMASKAFDADDFGAFLALLPKSQDGIGLRHVLDVRHASFKDPAFFDMARKHGCAIVFTDSDKFPCIDETTADFTYARLMMASSGEATGYTPAALDQWAEKARHWTDGNRRDVFVYFINGAKERAPAAAGALLGRLGLAPLA